MLERKILNKKRFKDPIQSTPSLDSKQQITVLEIKKLCYFTAKITSNSRAKSASKGNYASH